MPLFPKPHVQIFRKFLHSTLKMHPEFDHFPSVSSLADIWAQPLLQLMWTTIISFTGFPYFFLRFPSAYFNRAASIILLKHKSDHVTSCQIELSQGLCSHFPMASPFNTLYSKSLQWSSKSAWSSYTHLSNLTSYSLLFTLWPVSPLCVPWICQAWSCLKAGVRAKVSDSKAYS